MCMDRQHLVEKNVQFEISASVWDGQAAPTKENASQNK